VIVYAAVKRKFAPGEIFIRRSLATGVSSDAVRAYDASVSDRSQKIRARATLALRAQKAFGLDAIPIRAENPAETRRIEIPEAPAAPKAAAEHSTNVPTAEKRRLLADLDENQVKRCTLCRLCEQRTNTVFGEGDPDAKIMFIGEGPGENEDLQGRPFVGRAGDLLNKMILGMGLKREQVYIANIVKCRPPQNREPAPDEVATCTPYLEKQIEIIRPRVIVTLGRPALQHMLQQKISISRMRGQWQSWRGIRLMPTFHPAYILRSYTEETRAAVWSDLQQVMAELGMPIPKRKGT